MFLSKLFGRHAAPTPTDAVRPTIEIGAAPPADPSSPEMRIVVGMATDTGCVREINEDAVDVIRPDSATALKQVGVVAVVCDGMGGHEGGEVASRLAIEAFTRHIAGAPQQPDTMLVGAITAANAAVINAAKREPRLTGMGTTCTALVLREGLAYCAHVGDSRCYMVRDGNIFLMTEDHSAVMELVRQGAITLAEARHHPDKNVISRALGSQPNVQVSTWPRPLQVRPGDRFLVCSDGLHDLVSDADICAAVVSYAPQEACSRLVALARERGGYDNISVAILAMGELDIERPKTPKETRTIEVLP